MKGAMDLGKLQGALGRIESIIHYEGVDDLFELAAKYVASIAKSYAMPDANKRTALAVGLEYLALHGFEIVADNEYLADAVRDLVVGELSEGEFSDLLYSCYLNALDD